MEPVGSKKAFFTAGEKLVHASQTGPVDKEYERIFDFGPSTADKSHASSSSLSTGPLDSLRPRKNERALFAPVIDGLFIGQRQSLRRLDLLHEAGITHVLNVTPEPIPEAETQFICKTISAKDSLEQRLAPYFEIIAKDAREVQQNKGGLVVICQEGISRSATMVLAILMINHQLSLREAFSCLARKWRRVEPNASFMKELRRCELNIFHESSPVGLTPLDTLQFEGGPDAIEKVRTLLSEAATRFPASTVTAKETAFLGSELAAYCEQNIDAFARQLIFSCFESFASLAERDREARETLKRLLASYFASCGRDRTAIDHFLQHYKASDEWQDFCIDVPLAPKFFPTVEELTDARLSTETG